MQYLPFQLRDVTDFYLRLFATNMRDAMDNPRLVYVPRKDATPEGELVALAAVYRFLLDRHERRDDDVTAHDAEGSDERAE